MVNTHSKITVTIASCLLAGVCQAQALSASAPDSIATGDEAVQLLSKYLQIDTTNPPGNEILAANFFKAIFDKEGIESRILESAPGRASIYARLKGDGTRKPLVLLNHMDVVPADKRYWTVEPFGGVVKDGYIWGRGASDMKGMGIVELMAMLQLKRRGIPLKGDVIFLGTADEEAGGNMGAGFIVAKHFDLVKDAAAVINEGGSGGGYETAAGKTTFFSIGIAEKTPLWLKLTFTGEPGHGSTPRPDSSVNKLIRAANRILAYQPPLDVSDNIQRYFADTAPFQSSAEQREKHKDLRSALEDPAFAAEFSKSIGRNATVRNTISVTMLEASNKVNVIPPEASMQLDARLLPGHQPEAFLTTLRSIIADDTVRIESVLSFPPSSSPVEGPLPAAIKAVINQYEPGVPVTYGVGNGFTDCHFFREKGVPCYGFQPYKYREGVASGFHGNNEKLSIDNLKYGTAFLFDLVRRMQAD